MRNILKTNKSNKFHAKFRSYLLSYTNIYTFVKMEDTMTNISEENLNYIKTCIGYSLAKSTLYAIKTDTEGNEYKRKKCMFFYEPRNIFYTYI